MNISDLKLTTPAILLGNGLNNYLKKNSSWFKLLEKISKGKIEESFFETGDLTYPEYFDALSINLTKGKNDFESIKYKLCEQIIEWEGTKDITN
jgi:hypothetical protein